MIYSDWYWFLAHAITFTIATWAHRASKNGILMMPKILGVPFDVLGAMACAIGIHISGSYHNARLVGIFDFAACGFISFWLATQGGTYGARAVAWVLGKIRKPTKKPPSRRIHGVRSNLVKIPPNHTADVKAVFTANGQVQAIRACGYAYPLCFVKQLRLGKWNLITSGEINYSLFDDVGLQCQQEVHKDEEIVMTLHNGNSFEIYVEFMAFGWVKG